MINVWLVTPKPNSNRLDRPELSGTPARFSLALILYEFFRLYYLLCYDFNLVDFC
jgi:hypothetical protein